MSFPFGQFPTLYEYVGWCNQQGCTTRSAMVVEDGTVVTVHVLRAKSDRYVVVSGVAMQERLLPSQIANFDRRLGLDSPFPKHGSFDSDDC